MKENKKTSSRKFGPRVSEKSESFFVEFFPSANGGVEWMLEALPDVARSELVTAKAQFTREEKFSMIDVGNGLILSPMLAGHHLALEIKDGASLNGLAWGFDVQACVDKIKTLTPFQRMMLEVWAVAFWRDSERNLGEYVK